MKQLTILSTAILLSLSPAFAERGSFRDRSENWLQYENTEETSGNLRGYSGGGDQGTKTDGQTSGDTPGVGAIHDSLAFLALLSGAYFIFRKNKYQQIKQTK